MIIYGKNINLRTVEIEDAEFIYKMRQNKDKTKYLSKVNGSIETQKNWIESYKIREAEKKEFYFIIESKESNKLGLVRLYDFQNDSFCWGSWLIKNNVPKTTAIESVLQVYEFGFYELDFRQSHFDVRKGNDKVTAFHKRFTAKIVFEDEENYFFNYKKQDYENIKKRYRRYL